MVLCRFFTKILKRVGVMLKRGGCRFWEGNYQTKGLNGIFKHFCFKFLPVTKVVGSKSFYFLYFEHLISVKIDVSGFYVVLYTVLIRFYTVIYLILSKK